MNSRSNCPNVAGAYTPVNNRAIHPLRIASRSSTQSAPVAIPATISVSLPAGLAPAEATRVALNLTLDSISSDNPARSANPITGVNPANDTNRCSSKTADARNHHAIPSLAVPFDAGGCGTSAIPILPARKALSTSARRTRPPDPRIEA